MKVYNGCHIIVTAGNLLVFNNIYVSETVTFGKKYHTRISIAYKHKLYIVVILVLIVVCSQLVNQFFLVTAINMVICSLWIYSLSRVCTQFQVTCQQTFIQQSHFTLSCFENLHSTTLFHLNGSVINIWLKTIDTKKKKHKFYVSDNKLSCLSIYELPSYSLPYMLKEHFFHR